MVSSMDRTFKDGDLGFLTIAVFVYNTTLACTQNNQLYLNIDGDHDMDPSESLMKKKKKRYMMPDYDSGGIYFWGPSWVGHLHVYICGQM